MPRWRHLVPWIACVAVAAISSWALQQPPPAAPWLAVTAPGEATAGAPFVVRVRLRARLLLSTTPELRLGVDLHGSTLQHESRGWLGSAPPQGIAGAEAELTFAVPVPLATEPGFAHAVIYASPTGAWQDRVAVANSVDVPLRDPHANTTAPTHRKLHVYDPGSLAPIARRDQAPVRSVLALGWLAVAIAWWRRRSRHPATRRIATVLCGTAAAAATWELLPLERWLGRGARDVTFAWHWYERRVGYQHAFTVAVLVAAAALVMWAWRSSTDLAQRLAVTGITLHGTVTLASFLSLHAVDAMLAVPLGPVPVLQAVQLAALSVALLGVFRGRRDPA